MKPNEFSLPFSHILMGIVFFATLTRLLPHPPNFSPIDAIALLSGAYFSKRITAIFVTLSAIWMGDLFINRIYYDQWVFFYQGFYWQYAAYVFITLLGATLNNKMRVTRFIPTCLFASILFFVVSNLGVWLGGLLYPFTFEGLVLCYAAAIPFFKNTLAGDLFYSFVMFGSAIWAERKLTLKQMPQ